MGRCAEPKCLLDILTPNEEAFVVLVVVNNHDGWVARKNQAGDDANRKKCVGRWTRLNSTDDDDSTTTSNEGSSKKGAGRKTYSSGYNEEGLDFYAKARKFFRAIREDPRAEGDGTYYQDVLDHYFQRRQHSRGKRKRVVDDNEENAADYDDWAEL